MFEKILMAGTRFYKNPRLILALSLVLTLVFALGIPQIKYDNDVRSMLPAGNAEVAINNYYEAEDQFGNSNLIFIGVESSDAYSPASLGYVRELQTKIEALNETLPVKNLAKLLSLTPEEAQKVKEGLGSLGWNASSAAEILGPLVAEPAKLAAAANLDAALAAKIALWANNHSAVDLFRTWEAPIKSLQSLTDADDIVNEDDTLKVRKLVEGELTPEAIAVLKAKIAAWPVYQDALVSRDGTLSSLLVTLANLYQMPEYRSQVVGLVIPGIIPISTITQRILDRSNIPYLRTHSHTTAELHHSITEDVSKITSDDTEKLELLRTLAEKRLDFETLDELFASVT